MAGKVGAMSPSQARLMFSRVKSTKAANDTARQEQAQFRLLDPLERAKTFLRQQRFTVFAEYVLKPGSTLVVVGRTPMKPSEVIAMADRMRARPCTTEAAP